MKELETLSYMIGDDAAVDLIFANKGWPDKPFSDGVTDFLAVWSELIRHSQRKDPAVAAFGFWCRRAGVAQLKADYYDILEGNTGKGVCLQFVPNNIPALFAYSLAAGLLAGNSVIMRLPDAFDSSSPLIGTLKKALDQSPDIAKKVVLLKYPHDRAVTDQLSGLCDIRVIWGGNSSIAAIQESRLKEGAGEIVFPDRHSMAVISADDVLESGDLSGLVRDFFNDTYLNDQNACSSPNIIFWLGNKEKTEAAKGKFHAALTGFLKDRYVLQEETSVRKIEKAMLMAGLGYAEKTDLKDLKLVRVSAAVITPDLWKFASNGGFFIECSGEVLSDIKPLLTEACQTIAVFGVEPREIVSDSGNFRIVPIGHTLDFSLAWDGHDLIRDMVGKEKWQ